MNLNIGDIIKYILTSVVLMKGFEFALVEECFKFSTEIKMSNLLFYITIGFPIYFIYKHYFYDLLMSFQDWVILKRIKRGSDPKLHHNYRTYFYVEYNIERKKAQKIFTDLIYYKLGIDSHFDKNNLMAISIHFFYLTSIILFILSIFSLINAYYLEWLTLPNFFILVLISLISFILGYRADKSYEKDELNLLKANLKENEIKNFVESSR